MAEGPRLRTPVLSIAVHPKAKGDDDKLMTAIHRLQEEDTALLVRRDDETHQTVLSGMGDTHLQIVCEKLSRKFGVAVETEPVQVPYRETITKSAEAEGKYKKQTGGHGQFGVANLRVEPLERGQGFRVRGRDRRRARYRASSSPRWKRASRKRWSPEATSATPSSTSVSRATTASSTRSTLPR